MADSVISFVVDLVKEYAVKEAEALAEVGDRIMHLNDTLEWLQTFVRDADQKRRSKEDPFVAVWVRQTRDVAFEMEDVLDDYLRKTFLAKTERSRWIACFKCLTHPCSQLLVLDDLAKRMNRIQKRLTYITTHKDEYNIKSLGEPSSVWSSSSTTKLAAWDDLKKLVMIGFDDYEKRLKNELIGPSTNSLKMISKLICPGTDSLKMISIIGESGSGKTKLAREVYRCEAVRKHFRIRSWITLPPKYRVTDILGEIHKEVKAQVRHEKKSQNYEGHDISHMLKDDLSEDPYLVVLDGMASITNWNSIKAALPDAQNGSRVLIIMQSDREGVEKFVDPSLAKIEIKPLDKKRSTTLFLDRVFVKHNYPSWFKETNYKQDVFTLTQGVPLAIVILAGLLRSKESQAEWNSVFEQLKDVKRVKALDRILAMSFDDLPLSLKSCFLYFGSLSKTKLHDGHKLVRLWISEGFIKPKKGNTLEEIGQQHLKELISRCLVELVKKDAQGNVKQILIHCPVHDFVRLEAQEANFFQIHDNVNVIDPSTVRRLAIQNRTDKFVSLRNLFPKLRSLICDFAEKVDNTNRELIQSPMTCSPRCLCCLINVTYHVSEPRRPKQWGHQRRQVKRHFIFFHTNKQKYHTLWFLHGSKFLRVIDLQGLLLESLPKEVGSMIHLRYLGVKNCGLKQLPTSIDNLIHLQTLDVQDTDASNVGQVFWDIPTLRHIFAQKIKPPKYMKAREKENLQTLHGIDCTNWNLSLLVKAINLRSLEIEGLSNSQSVELIDALKKLEFLVHLKLKCSEKACVPFGIFNVSVLRRLQSLRIDGEIERAQDHESMHSSSTLPNLTKLVLRQSKVREEFIFMLAKFPKLSVFQLEDLSYDGKTLIFPKNGFQDLTELHLKLDKLKEWTFEKSAMPKLKELNFCNCSNLKMLPDAIKGLSNLKELMVINSHIIAERIERDGGPDYHKVRHVPIIRVRW